MSSAVELPNPYTPMAFLPPALAHQVTVGVYVVVGSMAILLWDILNNISADLQLLINHRIRMPTIVYFFARFATLAYFIVATLFMTAPVGNCKLIGQVAEWLYAVSIPSSLLLFFFRVKAIYAGNKYVTAFFAFLWLTTIGGSITLPLGLPSYNLGPTKYCIQGKASPYLMFALILPAVHDNLVFLAIFYKLMRVEPVGGSTGGRRKMAFSAEYLPALSRAILKDGQVYLLINSVLRLLVLITFFIKPLPQPYRYMFGIPNIALIQISASRVFRNTKFGKFRENPAFLPAGGRRGVSLSIHFSPATYLSGSSEGEEHRDSGVALSTGDDQGKKWPEEHVLA